MQVQKFDEYLSIIIENPDLHARWLNTFSFLEYIGFRKIVKSQIAESLSAETLSHAVEEGRHALRLKRLALKIGGPKFNSYASHTLLCGETAKAYFQNLDRYCEASFSEAPEEIKARSTYLYVTWLVEIRAIEIYQQYQMALQNLGLPLVLQGLLKEEEGHLQYVQDELRVLDPKFSSRVQQFKKKEQELYATFLKALTEELVPWKQSSQYAECT